MDLVAAKNNYLLRVLPDDEPLNPRIECDNFGNMVCFHRRYRLGDEHSYPNKDEFLFYLLTDTFGSSDKAERFLCSAERRAEDEQHKYGGYERAVDAMLLDKISEKHVVLPLYLYDHSVQSISTRSFHGRILHAEWDSGLVGWIYASKERILQEFGGKHLTKDKRNRAEELLKSEVKYYDLYLQNEAYGFELYENSELIQSSWGFMGDKAEVLDAIKSCLPEECQDLVDNLGEVPQKPSVAMLIAHAKEQQAMLPQQGDKMKAAEAR